MQKTILSMLMLSLSLTQAEALIHHVNHSAGGANDGSSWTNAYTDLQSALGLAVSGDQIWVAQGVYHPSLSDDTISFVIPDNVQLLGGFLGTETMAVQRDPGSNVCTLSGDLADNDDEFFNLPNSETIVRMTNCSSGTVFDGFLMERSYNTFGFGGGLAVDGGAPQVRNCTFTNNHTPFGGGAGAYTLDSNALFDDCLFTQNNVHLGRGGGIYVNGGSPVFLNTSFTFNTCKGASTIEALGAAIFATTNAADVVSIEHCTFNRNTLSNFYITGDQVTSGGAIMFTGQGSATVDNSFFTANRAHAGGAIFSYISMTIRNSLFASNVVTSYPVNDWISGGDFGGAIVVSSFFGELTQIIQCTFSQNSAGEGGAIAASPNHPADVYNSVIWGNMATGTELKPLAPSFTGAGEFWYSNVEGLFTPEDGEDPPDSLNFPGCMDENPFFVNTSISDYRLGAGAASIDAADNSWIPAGPSSDLGGGPRRLDDPATTDTGLGSSPLVDMGAYEFGNSFPTPPAPLLSIQPNGTSVLLSWTTDGGASLYHIYGTPQGGSESLLVTTTWNSWWLSQGLYDSSPIWTFRITAE